MKRYSSIALSALALAACTAPFAVSALTAADVNAQIQALMQQVSTLQTQLGTPATSQTPVPQTTPMPSVPPAIGSGNTASFCPTFTRNLARGARGDDVFSLQRFLLSQGLLTADSLTSYFGAQTESALQQWQVKYNIVSSGIPATTGWGVLGPRTQKMIGLNCALQASTPSTVTLGGGALTNTNQCPSAPRPLVICSGTWQAISDTSGCTTAWRCTIPLPGSTTTTPVAPVATSTPASQCAYAPRPVTACSGSWSALTNTSGCTIAWQCSTSH